MTTHQETNPVRLSDWLTAHPRASITVNACRSRDYFGYLGVYWEAKLKVGNRIIGKAGDRYPTEAIGSLANLMSGSWIPPLKEYFPEKLDLQD